jgi:ankyrin repeat protein
MFVYIYAIIFSLSGFAIAGPFHEAVREGDLEAVNHLIEKSSDVNVRAENGATPLHYAAGFGHIDIVGLLIYKGADVNAETKWHTLLCTGLLVEDTRMWLNYS